MRNRKNKSVKRGENVLEWNKIKKIEAKREREMANNDDKVKKQNGKWSEKRMESKMKIEGRK